MNNTERHNKKRELINIARSGKNFYKYVRETYDSNISQSDFAKMCGVNKLTLSRAESGRKKGKDQNVIEGMEVALNLKKGSLSALYDIFSSVQKSDEEIEKEQREYNEAQDENYNQALKNALNELGYPQRLHDGILDTKAVNLTISDKKSESEFNVTIDLESKDEILSFLSSSFNSTGKEIVSFFGFHTPHRFIYSKHIKRIELSTLASSNGSKRSIYIDPKTNKVMYTKNLHGHAFKSDHFILTEENMPVEYIPRDCVIYFYDREEKVIEDAKNCHDSFEQMLLPTTIKYATEERLKAQCSLTNYI